MSSKSKSQQRLMGWAKSIKEKGKDSKEYKKAPKEVKDLADSLSVEKLDDFASTKHKGLPKKVKKKSKKNETFIYLKSIYSYINENKKGYPHHLDNMGNIAGIEEEDLDAIVIIKDENGKKYAIMEDFLDIFLIQYPDFKIKFTCPSFITTIDEKGTTKEFNPEKDMIRFIDDEFVFPKHEIFVIK